MGAEDEELIGFVGGKPVIRSYGLLSPKSNNYHVNFASWNFIGKIRGVHLSKPTTFASQVLKIVIVVRYYQLFSHWFQVH